MQGTPKRGRRLGGDAAHQKAMLGNLVASLIAAESLVTTEAKAKALRPVAEKCITAAERVASTSNAGWSRSSGTRTWPTSFSRRSVPVTPSGLVGTRRILKLGPRPGDDAPMARIELV